MADIPEVGYVEPVDHHSSEKCEFRQRRTQPCEVCAKNCGVEAQGLQHTAAGRGTRSFRIVVGILFHRHQPNLGVVL